MAVLELNALSVDLSGSFSATVIMPENAGMPVEKKYPALFFIHDIGGNDTDIRSVKNLEMLANKLGIFIVAPALMHSFGLDLEWGGKYGHFVSQELPGICCHMFPIDRSRCYIGGTGWGAYGAVTNAIRYPEAVAGCVCVNGQFDIAALAEACLQGKALPHLRRPNLEALFAPLDGVAGGKFDLLSDTQEFPKNLYLACVDAQMAETTRLAKRAQIDVHIGSCEEELYFGALSWIR